MAVSLHGLRYKIAAAAVMTRTARRVGRLPGAATVISSTADLLEPQGQETSGSYRGIAAGLLRQALPETGRGTCVVYDSVAGLIPGNPSAPEVLSERVSRAEATPTAGNLLAAAAAHRKPYVADFRTAAEYYHRAFEANPQDLRAIEGILTTGARSHYDWPRIWAAAAHLKPRRGPLDATAPDNQSLWRVIDALFVQTPDDDAVAAAEQLLSQHSRQLPGLHQLLLETLAARLQYLGRFSLGFRLREAMAINRVRELRGIPLESGIWLKHLMGAYAYLDQIGRLTRTAAKPPVDRSHLLTSMQAAKLSADAALYAGNAEPLQQQAALRRQRMPLPGDQKMADLVNGKRVAVVGPSAGDGLGELIDSYDVVVRTGHNPAGDPADAGGRTDIAYYAGRDLIGAYDQVQEAADQGKIQMAVTRPFFLDAPALQEVGGQPQWLRTARFEYGLYFRGAPQGMQRIIYDLLQFAPAEIALFNADFYAGENFAAEGYRASYSAFGPDNQTNDVVAMHDLAYEFRFTQRLLTAGIITAHGTAAEVLTQDTETYYQRLESGPLV
ncbi:hypothetical protein HGQ17_13200 [Nesterenkonia sp. MY13]|uniref:Uncharacterized protein n=1 Tax=Nesterenkonia sedimenti TaxID=1463632 RepID=A0A7X8TLE7_9MICC|nr:hypothetical protein [Nesterenkonia sedimenti]NLS10932.1 hypothetical protein [Nesterenkonia sedimenti]